jgi:hypothetical protein
MKRFLLIILFLFSCLYGSLNVNKAGFNELNVNNVIYAENLINDIISSKNDSILISNTEILGKLVFDQEVNGIVDKIYFSNCKIESMILEGVVARHFIATNNSINHLEIAKSKIEQIILVSNTLFNIELNQSIINSFKCSKNSISNLSFKNSLFSTEYNIINNIFTGESANITRCFFKCLSYWEKNTVNANFGLTDNYFKTEISFFGDSFNSDFIALLNNYFINSEMIFLRSKIDTQLIIKPYPNTKINLNQVTTSQDIELYDFTFTTGNIAFVDSKINSPVSIMRSRNYPRFLELSPTIKDTIFKYVNSEKHKHLYSLKSLVVPKLLKDYSKNKNQSKSSISFSNCIVSEGVLNLKYDEMINKETGFNHLGTEDQDFKSLHRMYSQLKSSHEYNGNWYDADGFYYTWKQIERQRYFSEFWKDKSHKKYNPLHISESILYSGFNFINWLSCGYGVKPLWIFPFSFFIISLFAIVYFFVPQRISNLEEHLISKDKIIKRLREMKIEAIREVFWEEDFNFNTHKQDLIEDITSSIGTDELAEMLNLRQTSRYNMEFFWHCFYFSFSTFTTIGIGDWYPSGKLNKAIVMIEGALGWLCLGLFITTYANILLR